MANGLLIVHSLSADAKLDMGERCSTIACASQHTSHFLLMGLVTSHFNLLAVHLFASLKASDCGKQPCY